MAPLPSLALLLASLTVASACTPATWGPNSCVFADHMVLASNDTWRGGSTPARVFGFGTPGESITLSGLPADTVVSPSNPFPVKADGSWEITVSQAASLTNYTLTFTGAKDKVVLNDVLFGHTFLCSGQSNMDMTVSCTYAANETEVDALQFPEIRLMNQGAAGVWASAADVDPHSKQVLAEGFSATCYFTAYHLKLEFPRAFENVPIGLVRSSVGGQVIERFLSLASLEKVGVPAVNATGDSCGQSSHTLYDTIIEPLAPFVFKTMIWYQGESNVNCNVEPAPSYTHSYYAGLLRELVTSWQGLFAVNFTTLVAQLASFALSDPTSSLRSADGWPVLRAAQVSALNGIEGAGVVTLIDLGDDGETIYTPPCGWHGGIHPRNKTEVGRRLALRFGDLEGLLPAGSADGPLFASASAAPTGATVTFKNTGGALSFSPTPDCFTDGRIPPPYNVSTNCCASAPWGQGDQNYLASYPFELRLADGVTYTPAAATVEGATSPSVSLVPVDGTVAGPFTGLRFAWQGFPLCALYNNLGLPAAPFEAAL